MLCNILFVLAQEHAAKTAGSDAPQTDPATSKTDGEAPTESGPDVPPSSSAEAPASAAAPHAAAPFNMPPPNMGMPPPGMMPPGQARRYYYCMTLFFGHVLHYSVHLYG